MYKLIITAWLLAASSLSLAQQELIEMARQDIRAGRMGMVAASMDLTPKQQEIFWPLYREYADEQEQLLDRRIAMLQNFSNSLDNMDDETARQIAQESFAIQRARIERRERYFRRMSDALGAGVAARFIQVDSQISTLLDFEMVQLTPLLQPAESATE
ncbi:MAG: hypothetical protein QNI86_14785 [Halieaceae bacterium]|nr:hypothetical protein [Halieaceae bacterium]